MSIIKDFFNLRKKNKEAADSKKFEDLSVEEQEKECKRLLAFNDYKEFKKNLEKKPYMLSYIVDRLDLDHNQMKEVIYIGTKETDFDLDKLLERANNISKQEIVEIALKNKPEFALEKYNNRTDILNLLGTNAIIDIFAKYPAIIRANCDVLKQNVTLYGKDKNNKLITRKSTLLAQLKRAMNLCFRPEAEQSNGFDDFALNEIVSKIKDKQLFKNAVYSENMIKYVPTAANEMLKKHPEKARYVPGKTYDLWNCRTMYVVPNEIRKRSKMNKEEYAKSRELQLGELKNPSFKSKGENAKINLVKKCVKNVPENYFDICTLENYSEVKNNLAVQLHTYLAFKKQGKEEEIAKLFEVVGSESEKKILARVKANATRKANQKAKAKAAKEAEKELELK
ncbi:MAG: hypothetical protein IKR12_01030 [Clostridia bacterium]|nr:hypothetical protein [Clostridia bacterium]